MAITFNAGDVRRGHTYYIDPDEIVVDEAASGRHDGEAEKRERVARMAASIKEHGQLQPVLVRKVEGGKAKLVYGFTRVAAIQLLNKSLAPDERLQVCCTAGVLNDEEAFLRNIEENRVRNATSAVDDALNQRRLREVHGWDNERIAKLYDCSVGWVCKLAALPQLEESIREKVRSGQMAVSAALDFTVLPAEKRAATLKAAEKPDGKIDRGTVRNAVREYKAEGGGRSSRTVKEIREAIEAMAAEDNSDNFNTFVDATLQFISGLLNAKEYEEKIRRIVG